MIVCRKCGSNNNLELFRPSGNILCKNGCPKEKKLIPPYFPVSKSEMHSALWMRTGDNTVSYLNKYHFSIIFQEKGLFGKLWLGIFPLKNYENFDFTTY